MLRATSSETLTQLNQMQLQLDAKIFGGDNKISEEFVKNTLPNLLKDVVTSFKDSFESKIQENLKTEEDYLKKAQKDVEEQS